MSTQQSGTLSSSRDYLKCEQCRREHKKCLPRTRKWNGHGPKCDRCERLGNPCGPSIRAPKGSADGDGSTEGFRVNQSQTPRLNSSTKTVTGGAARAKRPIETWGNADQTPGIVQAAALVSAGVLVLSSQCNLHRTARTMRLQQPKLNEVSKSLSAINQRIAAAFADVTELVYIQLQKLQGPERRLLGWQLSTLSMQHFYLSGVDIANGGLVRLPPWGSWLDPICQDTDEACILSCTSKILAGISGAHRSAPNRPQLKDHDYKKLSLLIEDILHRYMDVGRTSKFPTASSDHVPLSVTFPASHIAYLNQDPRLAVHLWDRSSSRHTDADPLGRTFIHLAAASQDVRTIQQVIDGRPDSVRLAPPDYLGQFPRDLANQDSQDLRLVLRENGGKASSALRHAQPRPTSDVLAQRMESTGHTGFGNTLAAHESSNDTAQDAMNYIDNISNQQILEFAATDEPLYASMDWQLGFVVNENFQVPDQASLSQLPSSWTGQSAAFDPNTSYFPASNFTHSSGSHRPYYMG